MSINAERDEREQRQANRFIETLRNFLREPQPGELPHVYIATRQDGFAYRDEEHARRPHLYSADSLTIDEFMRVIYPGREYGDYRDLKKAEQYVMPGFDLYVVPTKLDREARRWDFAGVVGGIMQDALDGPNWEEAIPDDEPSKKTDDELDYGVLPSSDFRMTLERAFYNSGPLDLPHYHVNVCIGIDNYAEGWLGIAGYQTMDTEDKGKTSVELFNERYKKDGIRWGRMLTVRYTSYKPGQIGSVMQFFKEQATVHLGYIPEERETSMQALREAMGQLDDVEGYEAWVDKNPFEEAEVSFSAHIRRFFDENILPEEAGNIVKVVIEKVSNFEIQEDEIATEAKKLFEAFSKQVFGLSGEEFAAAYDRRVQWLVKNRDAVLIPFAHMLGLSPMMRRNMFDQGFEPVDEGDFPPGGTVLSKRTDENYAGAVIEMVMAYPVIKRLPDMPSISSGQLRHSLDDVIEDNSLLFVHVAPDLATETQEFIDSQAQYKSQYLILTMQDLAAGELWFPDTIERIFIKGYPVDAISRSKFDDFIKIAHEKIVQGSEKKHVRPAIVVFSDYLPGKDDGLMPWVTEYGFIGSWTRGDRDVLMTKINIAGQGTTMD